MQTLNDIKREELRLREAENFDASAELLNTVLPLLKSLAVESRNAFGEVAGALEEIVEELELEDELDDELEPSTLFDKNFALAVADTLRLGGQLLSEVCPDEEVASESDFGRRLLAYYEASNKLTALITQEFIVDEQAEADSFDDADYDLIDEDPEEDASPEENTDTPA